jgi:hypothetical protein
MGRSRRKLNMVRFWGLIHCPLIQNMEVTPLQRVHIFGFVWRHVVVQGVNFCPGNFSISNNLACFILYMSEMMYFPQFSFLLLFFHASRLKRRVVWWMITNIWEEYTVAIFRAHVRCIIPTNFDICLRTVSSPLQKP